MLGISDIDEAVPVWRFDDKAKLERPSSYWRNAVQVLNNKGSRDYIGRLAVTRDGEPRRLTELMYQRMIHLFEEGTLTQVGEWRNHYTARETGLTGFDTEGVCANFHHLENIA